MSWQANVSGLAPGPSPNAEPGFVFLQQRGGAKHHIAVTTDQVPLHLVSELLFIKGEEEKKVWTVHLKVCKTCPVCPWLLYELLAFMFVGNHASVFVVEPWVSSPEQASHYLCLFSNILYGRVTSAVR